MSERLVRYRLGKNGVIYVQTHVHNWWTVLRSLLSCFLYVKGEPQDVTTLNEFVNQITDELNWMAERIKYLQSEKAKHEKLLKETAESIESEDIWLNKGYSKWFPQDLSRLGDLIIRQPPPEKWKELIKPDKNKRPTNRERFYGDEAGGQKGGERVVVLPESASEYRFSYDGLKESFSADEVQFAKTSNRRGDNQGQRQFDPYGKKKQPGETDVSHRNRQKAISQGYFNPNEWDFQQQ